MPWTRSLILCLLCSVALERSGALAFVLQGAGTDAQGAASGTWSARSSTGLTLVGTWTAVADAAHRTARGTWTLVDAERRTVAQGGWSAAKSSKGWTGTWRAAVASGTADDAGTWSADVDLTADARFSDLFERAAQTAVSGTWRTGRHSGAWSIRAAK